MKVLVVGCDLSSDGGIASVVKMFDGASRDSEVTYSYVKTTNYKSSGFLGNLFCVLKAVVIFFRSVFDCDLVHVQGSSHASFYREFFFVLLSKLCFRPVVWNFHASRFEDFFGIFSGFSYRFKGCALAYANCIVVLAERYKKLLVTGYSLTNVKVLRNPAVLNYSSVDIFSERKDKKDRMRILFVGFFIPNKGVLDLLELDKSYREGAGVKFCFAGMGELEVDIQLAAKYDPEGIELLGWLDESGKDKAYKEADVLVLPSYREGMPIVILEAMASGLPVIATNIAAIPEQIEDGVDGLLYSVGDISGLKRCIDKMKDLEFRNDCAKSGLQKVQYFSIEKVFDDLIRIYKATLK